MSETVYWATDSVAVRDPEGVEGEASLVVPVRDRPYEAGHPLVEAYPWLFRAEGEEVPSSSPPDSVPIPQAPPIERGTRAPGERRPIQPGEEVEERPRRGPGRPRRNPQGVQPDGWGS